MIKMTENEPSDPEFLWVALSEAAASDFEAGRHRAAVEKWQNAYQIAQDFEDADPRRAGSLNNLAIGHRIEHEFDTAKRIYGRALDQWKAAQHWVERMQLGQRAHSSLFHLRMEAKHRKKYDDMARKKRYDLLPAGQAGTLNNLAELFHNTHRHQDAKPLYQQALQQRTAAMGNRAQGVTIIRENIACLLNPSGPSGPQPTLADISNPPAGAAASFLAQAQTQRWIVDQPAEFTDEGRLMAAILLTHLVHHARLGEVSCE